jgi:hypothetical protein
MLPELMSLFSTFGIDFVPHFTPLHYLPFIARSRSLKSKPALAADGFDNCHFRKKSKNNDTRRGFGRYAFLTVEKSSRILNAKLKAGFPHIAIEVPENHFDDIEFHLCKFNVAMTRRLRRGNKPGHKESPQNGYYYGRMEIPIGISPEEKLDILSANYPQGQMVEVLVPGELSLPDNTQIVCFDQNDEILCQEILDALDVNWAISTRRPSGIYNRQDPFVESVKAFLDSALENPEWRGNCLEFDDV